MGKQAGVFQRCTKGCPQRCNRHKFAFTVEFKPDANGKRQQVTESGFKTAEEARKRRAEVIRSHESGTLEADRRKETVGKYLQTWLEAKESAGTIRPATVRSYRGHVDNYLTPHLGRIRLSALKAADIDRMLKAIRTANDGKASNLQVSASTERRIMATLRSAIHDALKTGLIHRDPTIGAHVARKAGKRRDVWTPDQFATFRRWMEEPTDTSDHSHVERLAPLILLAAGTGLRRGEVCGLRWSDVDLDAGYAIVHQQAQVHGRAIVFQEVKTSAGQDRKVPMGGWVPDTLKAWKVQQSRERLAAGEAWSNDRGLVFTDALGGPLNPDNIGKTFSRMAERAGLPRVVFHSLRHLAARVMLQNGLPLVVVSELLGHSTIKVTADLYFDAVHNDRLRDDVTAAYNRAFGA